MSKGGLVRKGYQSLLLRLSKIINLARTKVVREINKAQVLAYWEIGKEIVEFEQKGKLRAGYGERLLEKLSSDMITRFGKGFSAENLRLMRKFYVTFKKSKTLSWKSGKRGFRVVSAKSNLNLGADLSWSHYCELLKVDDELARSFYERETIENSWSVRELKRQINSLLFERITLSKDIKKVRKLAKRGQIIEKPEDTIKDPYILEFLNLKEEASYTETQIEEAIIDKLQYFLLELGKGFTFVARQKKITVANRHYYIDLVLYNRILRCFLLIDLKVGELTHADVGQMNFYLNYFRENEKRVGESEPVGLILCAKKDDLFVKYVLGGLNNKIFASKYKLALPSEKDLNRRLKYLS